LKPCGSCLPPFAPRGHLQAGSVVVQAESVVVQTESVVVQAESVVVQAESVVVQAESVVVQNESVVVQAESVVVQIASAALPLSVGARDEPLIRRSWDADRRHLIEISVSLASNQRFPNWLHRREGENAEDGF
jgi:hypothetical protein